ncbi:MAG: PKD domain-containing protein [Clostridia bacterium]|nr:PKD domain-containing protein [Clostridia bacterium]
MKRINFLLAIMAAILTGCIEEPTNPQNPGGTTTPTETVTAEFGYKLTPPLKITLFDHSEGSSIVYDLGDGTTQEVQPKQAITHKYDRPGKYKIVARARNRAQTAKDSYTETVTIPEPDMYIYKVTYKAIPEDGGTYCVNATTYGESTKQYTTGQVTLRNNMLPYEAYFNATLVPITGGLGTEVAISYIGKGVQNYAIAKEDVINAGCPEAIALGTQTKVDLNLTYINPE